MTLQTAEYDLERRTLSLLLMLLLLAVGCGGSAEGPPPGTAAPLPAPRARIVPFPPEGPIEIRYRAPAGKGSLYRLQLEYSGYTYVVGGAAVSDPRRVSEIFSLELHYRQRRTDSNAVDEIASILVMAALKQEDQTSAGPNKRIIEIADDRLRVQVNDETPMDLRTKRRGQLGPSALLGRPFATMLSDLLGNPVRIDVRGRREARSLLKLIRLQPALRYTLPSFPPSVVSPGATWQARRVPASPIGRLGVALDVEQRLIAYEELRGVQCARIQLRASIEATDYTTALGLELDRVEGELNGEAWLDLATGQPYRVVMEDDISLEYERGEGTSRASISLSFSERAVLDRLDFAPPPTWADGSKRFES